MCFDKTKFIVIMLVAIVLLGYLYLREIAMLEEKKLGLNQDLTSRLRQKLEELEKKYRENGTCPPCQISSDTKKSDVIEQDKSEPKTTSTVVIPVKVRDVIRDEDYRRIADPLEGPTRRVPRHVLPPVQMRRLINIPTRGYPDNYQQLGLLIADSSEADDGDSEKTNRVLRLFGRETFPGSSRYEYYTLIANGLDQIKVPLENNRNQELYEGDSITVPALDRLYNVQLHPYDAPRYNPYLF